MACARRSRPSSNSSGAPSRSPHNCGASSPNVLPGRSTARPSTRRSTTAARAGWVPGRLTAAHRRPTPNRRARARTAGSPGLPCRSGQAAQHGLQPAQAAAAPVATAHPAGPTRAHPPGPRSPPGSSATPGKLADANRTVRPLIHRHGSSTELSACKRSRSIDRARKLEISVWTS